MRLVGSYFDILCRGKLVSGRLFLRAIHLFVPQAGVPQVSGGDREGRRVQPHDMQEPEL